MQHGIVQQHGPSECNNEILGVRSEFESPCAIFRASHCYIPRAHGTMVER